MKVTFRQLEEWPRASETNPRLRSPYTVGWQDTLDLLKRELKHLSAEHVVVEADIRESRIRADGWPHSDAKFFGPRVIVSFQHTRLDRWVRYPCDTFNDWEGNLRAIGLTLKDLRTAGGRGVLVEDEQYAGSSLELEAPGAGENAARALIDSYGGLRAALRTTHPDQGGDPEEFRRVQEAREVLGL